LINFSPGFPENARDAKIGFPETVPNETSPIPV